MTPSFEESSDRLQRELDAIRDSTERVWPQVEREAALTAAVRKRLIQDVRDGLLRLVREGVLREIRPDRFAVLNEDGSLANRQPTTPEKMARLVFPKAFQQPTSGGYQRFEDAMVAQARLLEFVSSQSGQRYLYAFGEAMNRQHPPHAQMPAGFHHQVQYDLLNTAEPIFVSRTIAEIVDDARHDFQVEPVLASDPFVERGFALFPFGLDLWDGPDTPTMYVRAVGWLSFYTEDRQQGAFWVSFYKHVDDGDDDVTEEEKRELTRVHGPLVLAHTFQWTWGQRPTPERLLRTAIEEEDPEVNLRRATEQSALVQTFWRLGQQFVVARQRAPRGIRRDFQRKTKREISEVNVVLLRRTRPGQDNGGESGRTVSVTFPVRGHWRNQWYPSLQEHRQKWIPGYIKGQGPWIGERKRAWEFRR